MCLSREGGWSDKQSPKWAAVVAWLLCVCLLSSCPELTLEAGAGCCSGSPQFKSPCHKNPKQIVFQLRGGDVGEEDFLPVWPNAGWNVGARETGARCPGREGWQQQLTNGPTGIRPRKANHCVREECLL